MPRNGAGVYVAPSSTWNPPVAGTVIETGDWIALLADLSQTFTTSIATDGQTTTTAMIPFAAGVSVSTGALATPSYAFTGDLDTGIYRPAANQISVVAGGVSVMNSSATAMNLPLPINLISIPTTASATVGVVNQNAARFIHNFTHSGVTVGNDNFFAGGLAGNFTMGTSGTNGARNVGVGYKALTANTTGNQNTAVGYISQEANTTGLYNTTLGAYSLAVNTTGANNTAIGADALWKNTTADNNTGVGAYVLQQITTGNNNTATGKDSMRYCTTAVECVAVGYQALQGLAELTPSTATGNVAIGDRSQRDNTTGNYNTAVGYLALVANRTGADNTAVGRGALQNSLGDGGVGQNTAVGALAGDDITDGINNQVFGFQAGTALTTGDGNLCIGYTAGANLTTGSNNVIIGNVNAASASGSNQLNIAGVITGNTSTLAVTLAGAATLASTINNITLTAPASTATLTLGSGKTITISNTLTMTGTDSSTVAFGGGGTVVYTTGSQTLSSKTLTAPLINDAVAFGGTGNVVYSNASGGALATGTNQVAIRVVSNLPVVSFLNSGGAADAKYVDFVLTTTAFTLRRLNDAQNSATNIFQYTHSDDSFTFLADIVKFSSITTTASAANAFLDSGNSNNLLRSTSSRVYKANVTPLDPAVALAKFKALRPITYNSRAANDDKARVHYGLLAEDVVEVDPSLVHFIPGDCLAADDPRHTAAKAKAKTPVPDGVQYERVHLLTLSVVQSLLERVEALEAA